MERNEDVRGKVPDPQIHTEGVPERTEKNQREAIINDINEKNFPEMKDMSF